MSSASRFARQALTSLRPSVSSRFAQASSSRTRVERTSAALQSASVSSRSSIRFASSSSSTSTSEDPTLPRAVELIEKGTAALEEGDLEEARKWYSQSVEVKGTTGGWYNLGVCEYHLNNQAKAIEAWEKSIELEPSSDALTNLASAYVMSKPPQPALAIKHLTAALKLAPNDPEIAFNLAAILESTDNLEPALKLYEKALEGGIERASQNVRSISAKILTKKAAAGGGAQAPASS